MFTYSPHRAIIALGAALILVAGIGGTLGIINAGRAERPASVILDRYVVLGPPVRAVRASVSSFQLVAERAFADPSDDASILPTAVRYATVTDREYLSLRHLLTLPGNNKLAPSLDSLEASYVQSRTGLAKLLQGGSGEAQSAAVVAGERVADAKLDAALGTLQATITTRLVATANQARDADRAARDDLLLSLAAGTAFGVVLTTMMARKALRREADSAERETSQARLTRRNEFEGRLQRALEMARAEGPVYDLVAEALGETAPAMRSEMLLADSSRVHFRRVLVTPGDTAEGGCGVVQPNDCPAASRGQTMVFSQSTALDACPHLRGRACSAACIPVSISGSSIGVVHVTSVDGSPPSEEIRWDVEAVARRASERLAMLRAFELSQTQANSDSLTGLVTRRDLERQVRDVQATGESYAVAYGDLDHFKQLNDVFGHDAGDRALRAFSQVLRDTLRPSDIACRYGGEEFVVLLPACTTHEAVGVFERVREAVAYRLAAGHIPSFTVSFGIASSIQAEDFSQVVAVADRALLQAKGAGRDRIVVANDAPSANELTPIDECAPWTVFSSTDRADSDTPGMVVTS